MTPTFPQRELPTEMREQLEDLGVYPSCRANRQRNKEGKKEEARNEDMEDAKKENEAEKVQKAEETKKEDVKLEVRFCRQVQIFCWAIE